MIHWEPIAKELNFSSTKEMLEEYYLKQGMISEEIGNYLGVNKGTVLSQLRVQGIKVKRKGVRYE